MSQKVVFQYSLYANVELKTTQERGHIIQQHQTLQEHRYMVRIGKKTITVGEDSLVPLGTFYRPKDNSCGDRDGEGYKFYHSHPHMRSY